jgi:hypothetical protein
MKHYILKIYGLVEVRVALTHEIRGWVCPKSCLDVTEKRKIFLASAWNRTPIPRFFALAKMLSE